MSENSEIISTEIDIKNKIYTLRDKQVIFDKDLAIFYGVKAIRLREQVKRNINRFPKEFMFQINESEVNWMVSQNAIPSKKHLGGTKPYVFTEQGVVMLAGILNSKIAIKMSIQIVTSFILMRQIVNQNLILSQKIENIEKKQLSFEIETNQKFDKIFNALETNTIEIKEGIFFEGQIFDAHSFISNLIRKAKNSIILIDNYIDDTVLTLFTKQNNSVEIIIYTNIISKQLELDLTKYNSQFKSIKIKELKNCHDRFVILDNNEIYHLGASLKDLGKKLFAFSKLEKEGFKILEKIN